jgi:hypothetical protein
MPVSSSQAGYGMGTPSESLVMQGRQSRLQTQGRRCPAVSELAWAASSPSLAAPQALYCVAPFARAHLCRLAALSWNLTHYVAALHFRRTRQASITTELIEIISGATALAE